MPRALTLTAGCDFLLLVLMLMPHASHVTVTVTVPALCTVRRVRVTVQYLYSTVCITVRPVARVCSYGQRYTVRPL